jgi:hypothetical protein
MQSQSASTNVPPAASLLRYIINSLLLFESYAARVAFICEDAGRSGPVPLPTFCLTRRIDARNHPRGGMASHPGRGCRIFSRSRKKSSTNEILANSNSRLTTELGVRCTAWSKIQVNSRIIPTMTSMELPITPGTGDQSSARLARFHRKSAAFDLSPVQKKFSVVPRFAATAALAGSSARNPRETKEV